MAAFRTGLGIFLLVASVYFLSSPGRIDSIDGQQRYDVTQSILSVSRPILRDPVLSYIGLPGKDGELYARFRAAPSVAALPLVWLGGLTDDPYAETRRFLFSLTTPLFGALLAVLLYSFYRQLEFAHSEALGWTMATAFATLLWPGSVTVLDQVQHAFFVLLALYLGYLAARRRSVGLATAAGLAAGVLFNYQVAYGIWIPLLGLVTLRGNEEETRTGGLKRYTMFICGAAVGLALYFKYNLVRFGLPFYIDRVGTESGMPAALGSPIVGLSSLLFSPGKSIFLYSPPILLSLLAFGAFWKSHRRLAQIVALVSLVHLLFISSLSFFGGDWCWGPRYLIVILPLMALTFPSFQMRGHRRRLALVVLTFGLFAQLLGLSIVHERFFLEQDLDSYLWASDRWVYFKESALFARGGEIVDSIVEGVPDSAEDFLPGAYKGLVTYTIGGVEEGVPTSEWMRRFSVFYLPRPWPGWMPLIDPSRHDLPIHPWWGITVGLLGIGAGCWLLRQDS